MNRAEWENYVQKKLQDQKIVYIRIKVITGSAKNEFVEVQKDQEYTVKIRIAAPAKKGKANYEIGKFFEKYFSCTCQIVIGKTTSTKLIKLSNQI